MGTSSRDRARRTSSRTASAIAARRRPAGSPAMRETQSPRPFGAAVAVGRTNDRHTAGT